MSLIDDCFFERDVQPGFAAPVKHIIRNDTFREMLSGADMLSRLKPVRFAPGAGKVNGAGIRIEQPLFRNGIGVVEIKSTGL